jgi:glycosyltransferase involved in cell wall biosynthesis
MILSACDPLVSVIIPTRARPESVTRAVKSVLSQSRADLEIIIVIDGADPATVRALADISDPRVGLILSPVRHGVAVARNIGVGKARGKWIAFLDDDDIWLPRKLEIQLQAAQKSRNRYPIIATRVIARSESGEFHWPRRLPRPGENLSEYMLCRKSPFGGEGLVLPSTIMTPKELVAMVPFTPGLIIHNDYDWLLRACRVDGACVQFVETKEPLAIWHIEENRPRLSNKTDWQYALSWIRDNRELVTQRAYASFVLTEVVMRAAGARDWRAFVPLLQDAYKNGKPSFNDLISYFGVWFIPREPARRIALLFDRLRRGALRTGRTIY